MTVQAAMMIFAVYWAVSALLITLWAFKGMPAWGSISLCTFFLVKEALLIGAGLQRLTAWECFWLLVLVGILVLEIRAVRRADVDDVLNQVER